jgi:hypothetical protein
VLRAAVFSIVLTLAAGPNTSLLCALWCHPADTAGPCEHGDRTRTPSITANDSCPDVVGTSTAFVREDGRRGVSAPQAQPLVHLAPFQFGPPLSHRLSARGSGQPPPLEARPLVLALRV